MRRLALWLLVPALGAAACDEYDAPPETTLVVPPSGQWSKSTPLELAFTEPIAPDTLAITIYPYTLTKERELRADAAPLVADCRVGAGCGEVTLTVAENKEKASLSLGDLLDGKEGVLFILQVDAGLADAAGRVRKVADQFEFQLTPEVEEGAVDADLDSGVAGIVADLETILPGLRLRMYLDLGVNPADGKTQVVGTVATLKPEVTDVSSTHIEDFMLYGGDLGDHGWVIELTGQLFDLEDGRFLFKSDKKNLQITVIGVLNVVMYAYYLELTVTPDAGKNGRASVSGNMTAENYAYGVGELTPTGKPASGPIVGETFLGNELPTGLPRVCDAEPCKPVTDIGGLCYLPEEWKPGPSCP
jgi:hypothetical protein